MINRWMRPRKRGMPANRITETSWLSSRTVRRWCITCSGNSNEPLPNPSRSTKALEHWYWNSLIFYAWWKIWLTVHGLGWAFFSRFNKISSKSVALLHIHHICCILHLYTCTIITYIFWQFFPWKISWNQWHYRIYIALWCNVLHTLLFIYFKTLVYGSLFGNGHACLAVYFV